MPPRDKQSGHAAPGGRAERTARALAAAPPLGGEVMSLIGARPDRPERVVRALEQSPALTSRLLATINSPGYPTVETVKSVPHAVSLLGSREARRMALSYAMLALSEGWSVDARLARRWWSASMRKACAAAVFCRHAAPELEDPAFSQTLMQDLGLLALLGLDPVFYAELPRPFDPWTLLESESAHFGLDHAAAGRSLLQRWGMDAGLVEALSTHHELADPPDALTAALAFAACLPHLDEPVHDRGLGRLNVLHERWAPEGAPSLPDQLDAAGVRAAKMSGGMPARALNCREIERRLNAAVAEELLWSVNETRQLQSGLAVALSDLDTARHEASTDLLTGLYNRRGFFDAFAKRMASAEGAPRRVCGVVCDLDRFKQINDHHGHGVGDEVLQHAAGIIQAILDGHLVCRIGGDEVCASLIDVTEPEAARLVSQLRKAVSEVRLKTSDGQTLSYTMSIGAAYCPAFDPRQDPDPLLRRADAAMYGSKAATRRSA